MKIKLTVIGLLLLSFYGWTTDEQGRMSMYVKTCFTEEFQQQFDNDLDGYLLVGNHTYENIDSSYLPRQYENDTPYKNCDLPVRRQKTDGSFPVIQGTYVECRFLVDNTSTTGGGPFDAPQTKVTLSFPSEVEPVLASNPVTVEGNTVSCNLGTVNAGTYRGVSIYFYAAATGSFQIAGEVTSSLFDPAPNNNQDSFSFEVIEPATELVFPWISKNDQFDSDIVINNTGSTEALIWLSAVRNDGDFHSQSLVIPPRGFLRESTETLFPEIGEGPGYSIRLVSDSSHVRGSWVTNNLYAASGRSPSQGVAINLKDKSLSKTRAGSSLLYSYLPISDTLVSGPVILNMGPDNTDVELMFYNQTGDLVFSDQQTLASREPYRPFATVANNLVPEGTGDVYMVATSPDQQLTGVGFVFNTSAEPSIGNAAGLSQSVQSSRLIMPWVSNNGQFESILVVNNLGDSSTEIQLTAQRNNGSPDIANRTIAAHGFLAEMASSVFPNLGDGPGFSVLITAEQAQLSGSWVTNNLTTASGRSPSQGVAINLEETDNPDYGQNVLFSFLPLTAGLTSGPVIVNVGSSPSNIVLRFYNKSGELVLEDSSTLSGLEPMKPFATVANSLLPEGSGDVYLVASSDGEPITGVGFVFNTGAEPAIGNVTRIDFSP